MNTGQIYYAISEQRGFLKLAGEIRYPLGQCLNQAVNSLFAGPEIQGVVVDLQEAEFIDSTCLGLLARVATHKTEKTRERPVIVSTDADINRLLETMGFDHAFVLLQQPAGSSADFTQSQEPAKVSARLDRQMVLDAHRALCEINENNRHLFQNVIEQLEKDAGKSE
jgi:anti-anti-sigma factor